MRPATRQMAASGESDSADTWALFAAVPLALVALAQRRLGSSRITMPMICLGEGFVLFHFGGAPFDVWMAGWKS
ncbi:MAG: hypothetical protein ACR2PF_08095 [Rhizobiaceae bacterium]